MSFIAVITPVQGNPDDPGTVTWWTPARRRHETPRRTPGMTDDELLARAMEEITALEESKAGMPFVFRPSEALMLVSVLQLALRHPNIENHGHVADFARRLAQNIEERLGKNHRWIAELIKRGWNPEFDT